MKIDINNSGVYIIENLTKNKFYIGSSINLKQRIANHFSLLRHNKHNNAEMQADFLAGDFFIWGLYKNTFPDHNQLLLEEKEVMQLFRNDHILYNTGKLTTSFFCNERMLHDLIADKYCKEHFNCSFLQLVSHATPAKIEMLRRIIEAPEEEKAIRAEFKDLIKYQHSKQYDQRKNIKVWYFGANN